MILATQKILENYYVCQEGAHSSVQPPLKNKFLALAEKN